MTEHFGDTPEDFDLDSWIDQGTRPHRTVKVYRDWALMDELSKLEAQLASLDEAEDDESMAGTGGEELREQYDALLERLAESALEITLRALTKEEIVDITAGVPEKKQIFRDQKGELQERWKPDTIAIGDALAAEATVSPKLNRAQITKMRQRLGDGPMQVVFDAVDELYAAGQKLPSLPFSREPSDDSEE